MKIKGLKQIEKHVYKFTAQFGCSSSLGTDFCYYPLRRHIEYALFIKEDADKYFLESVERLNPNVTMDIFLWSLLHEIGHHETDNLITDDDENIIADTKRLIEAKRIDCREYYNCKDERYATLWAVTYANHHVEELSDFWNTMQKLIFKFYKKNKIAIGQK